MLARFGFSLLALLPATTLAADLSGSWEVQSMGADREVRIEQKGNKIVAHRVMWPEFEGKRYKLEHLYRGQLAGAKLDGDLLVKEDELPTFEVLRSFTGNVSSEDKITIDGLPMKRTGKAGASPEEPVPAAPRDSDRPSDSPAVAKADPPKPPTPPPAASPATSGKPSTDDDPGTNLFASIMGSPGMSGMFEVALKVDISEEAKSLTDEADRLYGNGAFAPALIKYEEAQKAAGGPRVEFLHRIGRCHLKLKDYGQAADVLRRALKLDPTNRELKKDYKVASDKTAKGRGKKAGKPKGKPT